jgi:predicted cupin superfamily sugar epimerase
MDARTGGPPGDERETGAIAARFGLAPHPEGGFYRETHRARQQVVPAPRDLAHVSGAVSERGGGDAAVAFVGGAPAPPVARSASTAIYFLLPRATFSALHRVTADEVWHHYEGASVALHTIDERGTYRSVRLGRQWDQGDEPQRVVEAGIWQAAEPLDGGWALCGCTVAPGFEFGDFEMPLRAELVARFPALRAVVERLTRG